MTVYIYGLRCPLVDEIRYIGKSNNPERRLRAHISSARNHTYNHHTARWIRLLLSKGVRPELFILREVGSGEKWQDVERECIAQALDAGAPLTNSTSGGEGLDYSDEEARERYLANLSDAMRKYRETEEGREKFEEFLRAANDPGVVARRAESIRKHYQSDEARDKARRINKEINSRPEVKEKKSMASRAMWDDKETRTRIEKSFSRPETKARQSEKRAEAWADPVVGSRLREIHSSPEVRAKKSKAARDRATPEYRAMMAEATRAAWARRREEKEQA